MKFRLILLFCMSVVLASFGLAGDPKPKSSAADLLVATSKTSLVTEAAASARRIRSASIYRDPGVTESSNWLSSALEKLGKLFSFDSPKTSGPELNGLGVLFTYAMWTLLIAAIAAFAFFAIRFFVSRGGLKRKATGLMDEDEPERTADEWLAEADRLEALGEYRLAVRCLYLACLLRFDETGVARFDRGQTNWEHLGRIETSRKLPEGLEFRSATKLFDQVWYGHRVRGTEDLQQMRTVYSNVKTRTEVGVS